MLRHLILAFALVGMMLGNYHHHDDMQESDECKVCIIKHNIDVADVPQVDHDEVVICPCNKGELPEILVLTDCHINTSPSRAPPFFS